AVHQVRFNTTRELDSRILHDGLEQLTADRVRWKRRRDRERSALVVRRLQLVEGERKIAEGRTALVREKQEWEAKQRLLETELFTLHTRIVHEREKLQQPVAIVSAPGYAMVGATSPSRSELVVE